MKIDLMDEALKMPPNERVVLAELMLESIEHEGEKNKQAWLSEVKNRMQSVKNGQSKLFDGDCTLT